MLLQLNKNHCKDEIFPSLLVESEKNLQQATDFTVKLEAAEMWVITEEFVVHNNAFIWTYTTLPLPPHPTPMLINQFISKVCMLLE